MPYLSVEDFKFGMDRRRERVAGTAGTLWIGKNIHITRGGDIERRLKFVPEYHVPGTFGAATLRSQIYVFGSTVGLAATMPIGVQYQRLDAPGITAMSKLLDVKTYSGKFYVIAEYENGNIYHFYNGVRVSSWDTAADAGADFTTVANLLATKLEANPAITATSYGEKIVLTALQAGVPFSISTSTGDGGGTPDQTAVVTHTQPNVVPVTEVRASAIVNVTGGSNSPGVNQIVSITANGVALIAAPVDWSGSNESTALRVASAISGGFTTHGYSAAAIGATVTIQAAPGTGATPNGYDFVATPAGNLTLTGSTAMGGGVTAVAAVAQVETVTLAGTFQALDAFVVAVNGTSYIATGRASGTGRSLYVDKNRVWSPVGSLWRYCNLNDPTDWVGGDAGFLNIASATEGNERLVVAARYQGLGAVFSADNITLYQLDTDPTKFAFSDELQHTGTRAPQAVIRYGNNDVFYLDITGVRSLRARDASNAPFVSDIGNAIDPFVQELVLGLTKEQVSGAIAAIEPKDGRYLLTLGDTILVLSYFPGAKISAWSYYEPTEFGGAPVQSFVRSYDKLAARAGDYVYFYGGLAGNVQPEDDEVEAVVEMPFVSGKTPATIKTLTGFDIACRNTWACELAFDPNNADFTINIGNLSRITFADSDRIPLPGETSMVAPKLRCTKGGRATISMLAIHYEGEDAPG